MTSKSLADHIRAIPDYPKPGVTFRDITPLLGNGPALAAVGRGVARDPGRAEPGADRRERVELDGGAECVADRPGEEATTDAVGERDGHEGDRTGRV